LRSSASLRGLDCVRPARRPDPGLPIAIEAATLAKQLGFNPDPFLMAVAVGAACDFLTPIGHQCNTLVMGPGGYKFSDYPRLGAPLSLLVLLAGPPLILMFWPLS